MTEYVMYIAAIKLLPGKLAVQVGHAVLGLWRQYTPDYYYDVVQFWDIGDLRGDGGVQAKVVLRMEAEIDAETLISYCIGKQIPYYVVRDAGRTVVEPGTLTAIALGPVSREEEGPWKSMKLY